MARKKKEIKQEEMKKVNFKEIKEMESRMREKTIEKNKVVFKEVEKVSFDSWFFIRSKDIPKKHAREIIIVDFKARGLKNEETMEVFDEALKKYGVKL